MAEPRESSLHNPPENSKSASVFGVAFCDQRRDSHSSQFISMGLRIVSAVGDEQSRFSTRTSGFSSDRRNCFDQGNKLRDIIRVGSGQYRRERDAISIGYNVMLASRLRSVRGIRPDFRPPKTALTVLESATARHHSILSASFSLASITSWIFCQTPAFCQSRRYLQQLMPLPQPSSFGSISQGIPLLSTKMIPVSAIRLSIGFRPGYRYFLFFGGGRMGSMISHSSSGTRFFAINTLPRKPPYIYNVLTALLVVAHFVRVSKDYL